MLGKIFKAVVDTATAPLSVAADIITLGNVGSDEGSFTKRKIEQLEEDLDDIL
jgi:hypothetical protein